MERNKRDDDEGGGSRLLSIPTNFILSRNLFINFAITRLLSIYTFLKYICVLQTWLEDNGNFPELGFF
jgi:hypothetical protein